MAHTAVELDVKLKAPVLFVPEDYYLTEEKSVLILDLGTI